MEQTIIESSELHENAVIDYMEVEGKSHVDSIAPDRIVSDRLVFTPIHKTDFRSVRDLFRTTETETLEYYSERSFSLVDDIQQFIVEKRDQWQAGEKFEYVISYQNELVGKTYFSLDSDMTEGMIGLWLQQSVWGENLSQERADVLLYTLFEMMDVSLVKVGCVAANKQSLRSIEKYMNRYGGSLTGVVPTTEARFHTADTPTTTVSHVEFALTQDQYNTTETGITTTIPGAKYNDIRPNL